MPLKMSFKENYINVFLYILSFILVSFYLVIMVLAIKPNISWEYELYYITKETDVWPGNNGYEYKLGDKIRTVLENREFCKRLGKGWGNIEEDGCWSKEDESKIYFSSIPAKDLVFEMELSEFLIDKEIEIYFNDKFGCGISSKELENRKIKCEVKSEYVNYGRLVISLKYIGCNDKTQAIKCKEIVLYEK